VVYIVLRSEDDGGHNTGTVANNEQVSTAAYPTVSSVNDQRNFSKSANGIVCETEV